MTGGQISCSVSLETNVSVSAKLSVCKVCIKGVGIDDNKCISASDSGVGKLSKTFATGAGEPVAVAVVSVHVVPPASLVRKTTDKGMCTGKQTI